MSLSRGSTSTAYSSPRPICRLISISCSHVMPSTHLPDFPATTTLTDTLRTPPASEKTCARNLLLFQTSIREGSKQCCGHSDSGACCNCDKALTSKNKKSASVGGDYPYMAKICGIIAVYAQFWSLHSSRLRSQAQAVIWGEGRWVTSVSFLLRCAPGDLWCGGQASAGLLQSWSRPMHFHGKRNRQPESIASCGGRFATGLP